MENNEVYITIKLDRDIHEIIKTIAKQYDMTQSELINNICLDFIKDIMPK